MNNLFYRNPPKVRLFIRQYITWSHNLMLIQTPSWPCGEINFFYAAIYEGEILPHDIQHHHMRHHMHCTWVHIRLLELHIPRHRSYPFLVPNTTNMSEDVYSCSHVTTFNSFRSFEIIQGLNEFCRANNNCIWLYSIFVSQKSRELLWKISHIIYSCISTLYSWI